MNSKFTTSDVFKKSSKFFICVILFLLSYSYSFASVATFIAASGGTAVCSNSFTTLGTIEIYENGSGDFLQNQTNTTLILTVPAGFEFNPGSGVLVFSGPDITSASLAVTATTITVTLSVKSNPNNCCDNLKISGLQVKAINATPLATTGNIMRLGSNSGTATIVGLINNSTNFGTLTQAVAMSFVSLTSTQSNTTPVVDGYQNDEILSVVVNVTGSCLQLQVTSLSFNVNGSSNATGDISSAKVFYTGNSPVFSTGYQYGVNFNNPTGGFSVISNVSLSPGANYFWLAYDTKATCTIGNFIDAECTSVTISGTPRVPTVTAPAGNRKIGIITVVSNGTGGGNWNNPSTWNEGKVPDRNNNVIILDGDVITANGNQEAVDVELKGGAIGGIVNFGDAVFTIYGKITRTVPGNINTTCSTSFEVKETGATAKLIMPPGMSTLKKLVIDRTAGMEANFSIDLSQCVPVDSVVLQLVNGPLIITSGNKLLLNSIAIKTNIASSNLAYVDGLVSRKIPSNARHYFFPVGSNGMSRRIAVAELSGATGNHEIQFFRGTPPNMCCIKTVKLPGGITDQYYWKHAYVSSGGNGASPQRRVYYEDVDFPNLTASQRAGALSFATNSLATSSSQWDVPSSPFSVFDGVGQKYLEFQNSNNSNEQYWTLGSANAAAPINSTTLPIELIDIDSEVSNQNVIIDWTTASENNTREFVIQRSKNNLDFEAIGNLPAAGFSSSVNRYSFVDDNPHNGVSYYRLLTIDLDEFRSYSKVLPVRIQMSHPDNLIYPNPANAGATVYLDYTSLGEGDVEITVFDFSGRKIFEQKKNKGSESSTEELYFSNALNSGIYIVSVRANGDEIKQKLIIN